MAVLLFYLSLRCNSEILLAQIGISTLNQNRGPISLTLNQTRHRCEPWIKVNLEKKGTSMYLWHCQLHNNFDSKLPKVPSYFYSQGYRNSILIFGSKSHESLSIDNSDSLSISMNSMYRYTGWGTLTLQSNYHSFSN